MQSWCSQCRREKRVFRVDEVGRACGQAHEADVDEERHEHELFEGEQRVRQLFGSGGAGQDEAHDESTQAAGQAEELKQRVARIRAIAMPMQILP